METAPTTLTVQRSAVAAIALSTAARLVVVDEEEDEEDEEKYLRGRGGLGYVFDGFLEAPRHPLARRAGGG